MSNAGFFPSPNSAEKNRQQSATPSAGTAQIRVVRGIRGRHLGADLFCNGTPIAHISASHYLDLNLRAGWYRFSIKPDRPNVLIYAVPGRTYFLLSDLSSIQEADLNEVNLNTIGDNYLDFAPVLL